MAKRVTGPEIEKLIQLLARVPGLGPRSARRAALNLIKKKDQLLGPLASAMGEAFDKVSECSVCGNVDTSDPCTICTDPRRDPATLIVVEDVAEHVVKRMLLNMLPNYVIHEHKLISKSI